MKKNSLGTKVLLVVAIAVIAIYSCKKSDSSPEPQKKGPSVSLATDATHGQYLVDKDGYTLYFFANDYKGRNTCAGGCKAVWPYFYAGAIKQDSLGTGLNVADFDTIMVNGEKQTRYKGWPLYYYAPNGGSLEPAGQITGEAIANWFVAKPDYSIMIANGQMVGNDGKNYLSNYTEGTGKTAYFTDAKGLTLYAYAPDSFNINKFTKPDFSNNGAWPIYDTTAIVVPSTLDKTLFSSITVFGKHQLTYKGWPLYYFGSDDKVRGNTKGITVPSSKPVGSVWPIALKDMASAPHK
jgi:predicted lipoprotein with Yx(FWY)xxD motif